MYRLIIATTCKNEVGDVNRINKWLDKNILQKRKKDVVCHKWNVLSFYFNIFCNTPSYFFNLVYNYNHSHEDHEGELCMKN